MSLSGQLINVLAAVMLLIAFAMLSQRRILSLIELFAWMTETTIFRLNRVPEKLQVVLLELLGIKIEEPTPAVTELRFRLAAPAVESVSGTALRRR